MAIEFRCERCGQRLAAPARRAGRSVRCPRCRESIVVPGVKSPEKRAGVAERTPVGVPGAGGEGRGSNATRPDASLQVVGGGTVRGGEPDASSAVDAPVDPPVISLVDRGGRSPAVRGESITVSPTVVFVQGLLLAATAGLFFLAGMWVGRSGSRSAAPSGPFDVSGRVVWKGNGEARADGGAVVMLLPATYRPEEKLDPAAVRRSGDQPGVRDPVAVAIRRWGGVCVWTDRRGRFRLRAPRGGSYYLLIISAHAKRRTTRPRHRDLAHIGRYFLPAVDLLEDRAYAWSEHDLAADIDLPTITLEDER